MSEAPLIFLLAPRQVAINSATKPGPWLVLSQVTCSSHGFELGHMQFTRFFTSIKLGHMHFTRMTSAEERSHRPSEGDNPIDVHGRLIWTGGPDLIITGPDLVGQS